MEFDRRVAIVTGGTGALGSSVALDLLRSGARVAVTYLSDKEFAALEGGQRIGRNLTGVKVDLTQAPEVERMVAEVLSKWQRVDYLVAVAGGFAASNSFETTTRPGTKCSPDPPPPIFCLRPIVPVMIVKTPAGS